MRAFLAAAFMLLASLAMPTTGRAADDCVSEATVVDDLHDSGALLAKRLTGQRLQAFIAEKLNLPEDLSPAGVAIAQVWRIDSETAAIIVFDRHGCYLARGFGDLNDLLTWIEGDPV